MKSWLFSAALLLAGCTPIAAPVPTPIPTAVPQPTPMPSVVAVPTAIRCVLASPNRLVLAQTYTSSGSQLVAETFRSCQNPANAWTKEPLDTSTEGYELLCDGPLTAQSFVRIWTMPDAFAKSFAYDVCATMPNAIYR